MRKFDSTMEKAESWVQLESVAASAARVMFSLLLVFTMVFFTVDMFTNRYTFAFLSWMINKIEPYDTFPTAVIDVLAIALSSVLTIPSTFLCLSGGFLMSDSLGFTWGVVVGSIINIIGGLLGALLCYALSKNVFQSYVASMAENMDVLKGIDVALHRKGLEINIYLRLSPIIPSFALNYGIPALGSKFDDFMLGCFVGSFPYAIIYSFLGALLGNVSEIETFVNTVPDYIILISVVVGCLFLFLSVWVVVKFSAEALDGVVSVSTSTSDASVYDSISPDDNDNIISNSNSNSYSNIHNNGSYQRSPRETDSLLLKRSSKIDLAAQGHGHGNGFDSTRNSIRM